MSNSLTKYIISDFDTDMIELYLCNDAFIEQCFYRLCYWIGMHRELEENDGDVLDSFANTSMIRRTSPAIMDAILRVAGSEKRAVEIWEGRFTGGELAAIVDIVTGGGAISTTNYIWGDFGFDWERVLNDRTPAIQRYEVYK